MNRLDLILRVRSMTRDLSNSIFREIDIINYINEGIDRVRQVIPELENMGYLTSNDMVPTMFPSAYHHLLAVYCTSRCFAQDERHYQASTLMNEFESKLEELKGKIESGQIVIKNPDGTDVVVTLPVDYVVDNYFTKRNGSIDYDIDDGVDGVE